MAIHSTTQHRVLGKTGIQISIVSFGAGPVSALMTGDDHARQHAVVKTCVDLGINWFDTAASYGSGQSELSLGRVLAELGVAKRVHVATKVRLMPDDLGDIRGCIRRSIEGSLQRLRLPRVTLLQLHNSITPRREDEPTSITPEDVLGKDGVADAFDELCGEGLIQYSGLTGIGSPAALEQVIQTGRFDVMQVTYNLLNPSAGRPMPSSFSEADYGNMIASCANVQMGVLAIRVLAGGALANRPPSQHTLKTPFFPLELFERDRQRAARLQEIIGADRSLPREAIRFALCHPCVSSAIIGFSDPFEIDEALASLQAGEPPLDWEEILARLFSDG
jgi:aryl-alcohol dehydrogenase-like predicted oxidoreductase